MNCLHLMNRYCQLNFKIKAWWFRGSVVFLNIHQWKLFTALWGLRPATQWVEIFLEIELILYFILKSYEICFLSIAPPHNRKTTDGQFLTFSWFFNQSQYRTAISNSELSCYWLEFWKLAASDHKTFDEIYLWLHQFQPTLIE